MRPAHDGHNSRLPRHPQARQLFAGRRGPWGKGHFDEVSTRRLELHDPDQRTYGDRLFYERGQQVGSRYGDVHPPGLVEKPVVLRVVDAANYARYCKLLFGEQGNDEVVLVVARRGYHDVRAREAGSIQGRNLARVPHHPFDAEVRPALGDLGILFYEQDLVAGLMKVGREVAADVASPRYDHFHARGPRSRCSSRASSDPSKTDT